MIIADDVLVVNRKQYRCIVLCQECVRPVLIYKERLCQDEPVLCEACCGFGHSRIWQELMPIKEITP